MGQSQLVSAQRHEVGGRGGTAQEEGSKTTRTPLGRHQQGYAGGGKNSFPSPAKMNKFNTIRCSQCRFGSFSNLKLWKNTNTNTNSNSNTNSTNTNTSHPKNPSSNHRRGREKNAYDCEGNCITIHYSTHTCTVSGERIEHGELGDRRERDYWMIWPIQ